MMSFKKYITGTISRIKIAFITAKTLSVLFSFLIGGVISDLFHDSTPYLGSMLAAISSIVVLPEEDFDKTLKVGWRRGRYPYYYISSFFTFASNRQTLAPLAQQSTSVTTYSFFVYSFNTPARNPSS